MRHTKTSRWLLLSEVYKKRSDEAGAKVVAQKAVVFAEISKLEQLQQYSSEYACDQNAVKSTTLLDNSRKFFARLSHAIDQQAKMVDVQKTKLQKLEKVWFEYHRKQKSFHNLVERGQKLDQDDANSKEQTDLDEWNSTRFDYPNDV